VKDKIQKMINLVLQKKWHEKDFINGKEIDLTFSQDEYMKKDYSVIIDYINIGWDVMHYHQGNLKGNFSRSWLRFKSPNYRRKKK
jgi:hypothetical protein